MLFILKFVWRKKIKTDREACFYSSSFIHLVVISSFLTDGSLISALNILSHSSLCSFLPNEPEAAYISALSTFTRTTNQFGLSP